MADFWSKVSRRAPSECWEFTGARDENGYGRLSVYSHGTSLAHRKAWEETNGPIPPGMFVCHRCDNPPCCNPGHLFLGTNLDNTRDRVAKGRPGGTRSPLRGESALNAKLDAEKVREIRRLAEQTGGPELARRFGVAHSLIYRIVRRKAWAHVA